MPGRGQNGNTCPVGDRVDKTCGNTCPGAARMDNTCPGGAREEMCPGGARTDIRALASERHAQVGPEVEISALAGRELAGMTQAGPTV